jgi:hypothetical protein
MINGKDVFSGHGLLLSGCVKNITQERIHEQKIKGKKLSWNRDSFMRKYRFILDEWLKYNIDCEFLLFPVHGVCLVGKLHPHIFFKVENPLIEIIGRWDESVQERI